MRTREAQLGESLGGIVLLRISLKLRTNQLFDFLHQQPPTFAERHFTVCSLGTDSSAYIYYIKNNKRNQKKYLRLAQEQNRRTNESSPQKAGTTSLLWTKNEPTPAFAITQHN